MADARTLILNVARPEPPRPIVRLRGVVKTYKSPGGDYVALKGVDLDVATGEYAAVIGKSGSGKSTLINIVTAIDRPSSGEVHVAGAAVHDLDEGEAARWRGRSLGVVFQFFQLLPALTLLENVMLPMDLCDVHSRPERPRRALDLLDHVGLADHAHRMPSELSGGQQQRVAIARALANDPPLLVADEPTGSLDSKNAEAVFDLFAGLVRAGKTILMVTHDHDLARRATRTVLVADGLVVNQYVTSALSMLDLDQVVAATHHLQRLTFPAGSYIVREGDVADRFYILVGGEVDVILELPGGEGVTVNRLRPGHYFGEIAMLRHARRTASIRAWSRSEVEVMALDSAAFDELAGASPQFRQAMQHVIDERLAQLRATAPS